MADNNFSGLNVSTGQGEGAANVLNWTATDKAINQLYAEQKQREARGYQEYAMGQNELAKEMANVRSADVPELRQLYDQQKQLRQEMLFNPKLMRDREAYSNVEKQYNATLAKLHQGIRGSVETMDFDKGLVADRYAHKDDYADDASALHAHAMQLPTSQRVNTGLNSAEPYLNHGSNTDFGTYLKTAQGEATQTTGVPTQLSKDGLQFVDNAYKHGNNPSQIASALTANFGKHGVGRDAAWNYKNLPDDEKIKTQQDFDKLGQDYWDKWGVKKESQNLQQGNGVSEAQKYAIYLAQKAALQNEPQLGEPKYRNNEGALANVKSDLALRNAKIIEGMRQGGRKELLSLREHYKKLNKQEQGELLDGLYNDLVDRAKKNPKEYTENGTTTKQYDISANQHILNMYKSQDANGHTSYPDRVRLRDNGDVQVIFFKRDKDGKKIVTKGSNAVVNTELSTITPAMQFKIMYGKSLIGQTETNKEANGNDDDESGEEYDTEYKQSVPINSIPDFLKKK